MERSWRGGASIPEHVLGLRPLDGYWEGRDDLNSALASGMRCLPSVGLRKGVSGAQLSFAQRGRKLAW